MMPYLIRRILWLIPTLLAMALVTFLVMHATPGSPLEPEGGNNPLSPAEQQNLAAKYGLDRPLWEQFGVFLVNALRGDFGHSYVYKTRTVAEILWDALPVSLRLGAMAMVMATCLGVGLGVLAAVHQNSLWDYLSVTTAMVAVSIPNFVMAVFLILLFSFLIPVFPTGGWGGPRDWVLPTITLSLTPMAIIARYTRASMLEVIRSEYVTTARAKGLSERPVVFKHALKNALIPTVTVMGLQIGFLIGGAIVVETLFAMPGLGTFGIDAIIARDYQQVQGFALLTALAFVIMNLAVDLTYTFLDPRIRYA